LKSGLLIAPCYYILSGVQSNEGVVLSRNRNGDQNIYPLDVPSGRWFIVQTNYDRNTPDPVNDTRRIPAEKRLESIGQGNITVDNLFTDVLSLYPNLNVETVYTSIFSAMTGYFNTTMWY